MIGVTWYELKKLGIFLVAFAYCCFLLFVPNNPHLYTFIVDIICTILALAACVALQVFLLNSGAQNIMEGLCIQYMITQELVIIHFITFRFVTNLANAELNRFYSDYHEIAKYVTSNKTLGSIVCASLCTISAARLLLIASPACFQGIKHKICYRLSTAFIILIFVSDLFLNHVRCLLTHSKEYTSISTIGTRVSLRISYRLSNDSARNTALEDKSADLECFEIPLPEILLLLSCLFELVKFGLYFCRLLKKLKQTVPHRSVRQPTELSVIQLQRNTVFITKLKRSTSAGDIKVQRTSIRRLSLQTHCPTIMDGQPQLKYSEGPDGQKRLQSRYSEGLDSPKKLQSIRYSEGSDGPKKLQSRYSEGPDGPEKLLSKYSEGLKSLKKRQRKYSEGTDAPKNLEVSIGPQKLQSRYSEGPDGPQKLQSRYSEGPDGSRKLQSKYSEGSDGPKKLQSKYSEGSDGLKKLQSRYSEGSDGPKKLQSRYSEGSDGPKKLQSRYSEGPDGSRKLQSKYSEGSNSSKKRQRKNSEGTDAPKNLEVSISPQKLQSMYSEGLDGQQKIQPKFLKRNLEGAYTTKKFQGSSIEGANGAQNPIQNFSDGSDCPKKLPSKNPEGAYRLCKLQQKVLDRQDGPPMLPMKGADGQQNLPQNISNHSDVSKKLQPELSSGVTESMLKKIVIKPLKDFFFRSSTVTLILGIVFFIIFINLFISYKKDDLDSSFSLFSSVIRFFILGIPVLLVLFDNQVLSFIINLLSC